MGNFYSSQHDGKQHEAANQPPRERQAPPRLEKQDAEHDNQSQNSENKGTDIWHQQLDE
ncbi:hypothetical protein D3C72_2563000 [compost metagenome]